MELVIHHWDADGIGSAVLWSRVKGGSFSYFTPEIGNYFLSQKDRKEIEGRRPDSLVLLDMSLPEPDLKYLNSLGPFTVVDHHHGVRVDGVKIINPTLEGREAPSNTRVLTELFSLPHNDMEYLGLYGDNGFKLKEDHPLLREMREFYGERFHDFVKAVKVVDLQYKTGDRQRVYAAVEYLLERPLLSVLEREEMVEVEAMVEEEIRRELERTRTAPGLNFLFTPSKFRIVSDLTRRLFARAPESLNLVVGLQGEFFNFYLRTSLFDLSPLVRRAKALGFYAGGKKDVIGAVVEKERVEEYLSLLEEFLAEKGSNRELKSLLADLF